MKRYEKFVFEAEKGIILEASEGTSGELVIKAKAMQSREVVNKTKENVTTQTAKTDNRGINYENPPIPKGYEHICGEWNNGFVIERETDGSQFVWVPVGSLAFFGRRLYREEKAYNDYLKNRYIRTSLPPWHEVVVRLSLSREGYHDSLTNELTLQQESIKKYGGFYISRYNISKSSKGKPQSIKGAMPWVNIDFLDARKFAANIEDNEAVKSHLTYGAEYDSVLEWFIESKVRTLEEIAGDSTNWGNYLNTKNFPSRVFKTGSREKWCTNNIYDFAGNVSEWTQEKYERYMRVASGGSFKNSGRRRPVSYRDRNIHNYSSERIGFRATLYIK